MDESLDSVLEKCLASCAARSPYDALAVALHACLLAEGYVCVATGDENFGDGISTARVSPSIPPSRYSLPVGWNSSQEVYALQYFQQQSRHLCLIKMIIIGSELLISAMAAGDTGQVITCSLDTDRYLQSQQFTTVSAYSNLLQLMSTLNKDIVSKLLQSGQTHRNISTHSTSSSSSICSSTTPVGGGGIGEGGGRGRGGGLDSDPLRVGPPRRPGGSLRDPLAVPSPFGYGDADRLPFGSGVGGMYFDPLGQRGPHQPFQPFPPSHPPGARFDPVTPFGGGLGPFPRRGGGGGGGGGGGRGPGRTGRYFGEPDPDHLPPPGSDDMFS